MPNWCFNTLNMRDIKRITSLTPEGKETFDFNTIVPMPPSLNLEDGSRTSFAIVAYVTNAFSIPYSRLGKKRIDLISPHVWCGRTGLKTEISEYKKMYNSLALPDRTDLLKDGNTYVDNIKQYGYATWYGWRNANWGTKWNACDVDVSGDTIWFDTAWAPPFAVIEALSRKFPDEEIDLAWDEESGWRGGQVYMNGKVIEEYEPETNDEEEECC